MCELDKGKVLYKDQGGCKSLCEGICLVFLATTVLEGRKAAAQAFGQTDETGILSGLNCQVALQGLSLEIPKLFDG